MYAFRARGFDIVAHDDRPVIDRHVFQLCECGDRCVDIPDGAEMALDLPLQRGAHTGNLCECEVFGVGNQGNVLHNSRIIHYFPPDVWEMPRCLNHLPVTDLDCKLSPRLRERRRREKQCFDRHKCYLFGEGVLDESDITLQYDGLLRKK
jgi:hypothetical protein